jgi:hypothetical protein
MRVALEVIIEAVEIIRSNPDDKAVLREQLGLIYKYAKMARLKTAESQATDA